MSLDCTNLFNLARNKLQSSFTQKDRLSLHRWVLLKNSILNSSTLVTNSVSDLPEPHSEPDPYSDEDESADEEALGSGDVYDFMFPDAGNFVAHEPSGAPHPSEAQWLDSLLETLGDDDDDDDEEEEEEEEDYCADSDDQLFTPPASPLSSLSDDLSAMKDHPHYYSADSVSYPVISPYPPFHPPLVSASARTYAFLTSDLASLPAPCEDPLPFSDDVDDMPVPDAIEDTSDDESSDSPSTPSMGGSRLSLFVDDDEHDIDVDVVTAASIPLPPDRSSLGFSSGAYRLGSYHNDGGVVSLDSDVQCHFAASFDPLPFSTDAYNLYPEC